MDRAILLFFQSIRNPVLDVVFSVFSFFGEAVFLSAAVILIYWLAEERTGEQIAVTVLSSLAFNTALKCVVSRPRPYAAGIVSRVEVDNFFVSTEGLGDNLSFPSGHAQHTAAFTGALSLRAKKIWVWIASAAAVLLVMCSRLYLGVHYPTDLLAGLLFGACTAALWAAVYRYAYGARYFLLCGLAVAALAGGFFLHDEDYMQAVGLLSGAALCVPMCKYFLKQRSAAYPKRLLRIPAGVLAVGVVFALTLLFPEGAAFKLLKWFLFACAATLGAQSIFKALKI